MPDEQPRRNIDDRIDALAQTLELLAAMHQDFEKQTAARFADVARNVGVLTERTIQAMDAINRLANIAEIHEHRLSDLEGDK